MLENKYLFSFRKVENQNTWQVDLVLFRIYFRVFLKVPFFPISKFDFYSGFKSDIFAGAGEHSDKFEIYFYAHTLQKYERERSQDRKNAKSMVQ